MYSSIRIRGFRGLDDFRMEGLGRVNLLVGANNCGKTSVLECVQLLSSPSPSVLSAIAIRRGEWHVFTDDERRPMYAVSTSHLFMDRDFSGEVVVTADRCAAQAGLGQASNEVRLYVDSHSGDSAGNSQVSLFADRDLGDDAEQLVLRAHWTAANEDFDVPLTNAGGLLMRAFDFRRLSEANQGAQFIGSNGMTAASVARLFDDVVLTDNEELVTCSLRILEPRVERVAAVAHDRGFLRDGPGGIFVKLRDVQERVPIGSTGDGMWRMLGLALMLAKAKGGILLVDEIDTGLHYTVMENMWRMVCEQAAALSVQVFATTHSRDCYESLAAVVKADSAPTEAVTIQRIEQHRNRAVAISGDAIVVAAERGLEVR